MAEADNIAVQELAERAAAREEIHHHDPSRNSAYYYLSFWRAFKDSTKGLLLALAVGPLTGGVAGLIAAPLVIAAVPAATIPLVVLAFGAAGTLFAVHKFTAAGNAAGAAAASSEMLEARVFTGVSQMLSRALGKQVDAPCPGDIDYNVSLRPDAPHLDDNPHMASTSSDNGKWFHWKIGLSALVIGAAAGALLAGAVALAPEALLLSVGLHAAHVSVVGVAAATGLFSAVFFGTERNLFRQLADTTDKLFAGNIPFITNEKNFSVTPQNQRCFTQEPSAKAAQPVNTYASREELEAFADPRQGGAAKSWQDRVGKREATVIKPRAASAVEAFQQERDAMALSQSNVR